MDTTPYRARSFDLTGLVGISDKTTEMHLKLYEGYVKETNSLNDQIAELVTKGEIDPAKTPAYAELTRRLGFEYNGMVLHEYYFANLKPRTTAPSAKSAFGVAAAASFGSFETWKAEFVGVGKMRGVGWAICYEDPRNGRLSNHWTTLHEVGNVTGFRPLLVMDVWEHAFLLDQGATGRAKYIEAFFANVDWDAVEHRLAGEPDAREARVSKRA